MQAPVGQHFIATFLIERAFHFSSNGFTYRPWPRAPRFWGPAQLLPMTTHYSLKICETAQRHNFTTYFETSENVNVFLDSWQYKQHDNIVGYAIQELEYCGVWRSCAVASFLSVED